MAHNFKMNIHCRIDKLFIRLTGDFDGNSAFELLNALSENLNNTKYILIDTKKLQEVYPFGREVFYHANMAFKIKADVVLPDDIPGSSFEMRQVRLQYSIGNIQLF